MRQRRQLTLIDPRRFFADDWFDNVLDNRVNNFSDFSSVSVDLYEDEDNVVARMSNLSGFEEKDLDISIEDNVLTVSGNVEEREEEEDKKKKYYRKEIRIESFSRSLTLPVKVKSEKADAELKNGVLEIKIPKAEEVKPKRISIKAKS